jgi:hypothetical protein
MDKTLPEKMKNQELFSLFYDLATAVFLNMIIKTWRIGILNAAYLNVCVEQNPFDMTTPSW